MLRELPEGFSVKFRHTRHWSDELCGISPKGGETEAFVYEPGNNHVVAFGAAYCSPKDNFSRPLGRKIALGRALQQLTKEEAK